MKKISVSESKNITKKRLAVCEKGWHTIYLIDMLEQWGKEGYHRVNKKKENKKNYQYETERKGKKRNNT